MTRAYHYMPIQRWQEIASGRQELLPHSPLIHPIISTILFLPHKQERGTFALLDSAEPESWTKTPWLNRLQERQGDGYAIISFPATEGLTVLAGERLYNEMDKLNAFGASPLVTLAKNFRSFRSAYKEYLASRIPVSEYTNQYSMPEGFITKAIPYTDIALERIVTK